MLAVLLQNCKFRKMLKDLGSHSDLGRHKERIWEACSQVSTERTPKPFLLFSVLRISEKMRSDAMLCAERRIFSMVSKPDF